MLEFRTTNFRQSGSEFQTIWQFEPLKDRKLPPIYHRDSRADAEGKLKRRPYAEQFVKQIVFGPELVLLGEPNENFLKLQRAHRWEFSEMVGTKKIWTRYAPDISTQIELQFIDDLDKLAMATLVFVEETPRPFWKWYK